MAFTPEELELWLTGSDLPQLREAVTDRLDAALG